VQSSLALGAASALAPLLHQPVAAGAVVLGTVVLLVGSLRFVRGRRERVHGVRVRLDELASTLPFLAWVDLDARIRGGLSSYHRAWTAWDLGPARDWLDREYLFEQQAWLDRLKGQGRRHRLELLEVHGVQPLRFDSGDRATEPLMWVRADVTRVDLMEEPGSPHDPPPVRVSLHLCLVWDGDLWRVRRIDDSGVAPAESGAHSRFDMAVLSSHGTTMRLESMDDELPAMDELPYSDDLE
jgi:hypothetical protein